MRVAVIADAHGNHKAVEAAIDAIESEKVDLIVAAGDMINPFPGSTSVWDMLNCKKIKYLKGNQEEYLIFHACADELDPLRSSTRYLPVQITAGMFTVSDIDRMQALPLSISVGANGKEDLLICHGTPFDPWRSISDIPDDSLQAQFRRVRESTIIAGHYHRPWRGTWQKKKLTLCGSCGFPMTGNPGLSYMIAESRNQEWDIRDVSIPYDREGFILETIETGFLRKCGPIGWLIFADFVLLERHLMDYFENEHKEHRPETYDDYVTSVKRHFERTGILSEMISYIGEAI